MIVSKEYLKQQRYYHEKQIAIIDKMLQGDDEKEGGKTPSTLKRSLKKPVPLDEIEKLLKRRQEKFKRA